MKYMPEIFWQRQIGLYSADATLGGRMNFNYRKIEQRNRKLAYFPFVVYWRHYG
jgi:hypothetical protein